MRSGRGGITAARAVVLSVVGLACGVATASAGEAARSKAWAARSLAPAAPALVDAETVTFADPRRAPVKLLRGRQKSAPPTAWRDRSEIVGFGNLYAAQVTVIRGGPPPPAPPKEPAPQTRTQTVTSPAPPHPPL